jgi:S-adenosylmethionine:tRNA ribosyltransferase-isomerase
MQKSDFNYDLPEHLIAQQPLAERRASRMLRLNRRNGAVEDDVFENFINHITPLDLLVFNDTRVIPARLFGKKTTGGRVEILIERITGFSTALAHIRASKSPKPGSCLELEQGFTCEVTARQNDLFELKLQGDIELAEVLDQIGHIPLPPYIERSDNINDHERYQTVFAQQKGAVAAPTAGLHFDEQMLDQLKNKGVDQAFVTLHVGSGTFQPVRVDDLAQHHMHSEFYRVTDTVVKQVEQAKQRGGRVIAIGTTAVRALESASQSGRLLPGSGDTQLFITPGYTFKTVDALLTNFHLPESTLLMLIAAFAGYDQVMSAYQHAILQQYRFFSYGDAMWIA